MPASIQPVPRIRSARPCETTIDSDRSETALRVPRTRASEVVNWVERAEVLFASGASSRAVAMEMGYGSTRTFSTRFKQLTGRLPPDTQMENGVRLSTYQRVEQVRLLLATGNYTVDQVVGLAGFNNRQGLEKGFKKVDGMSPAQRRRWDLKGVTITIESAKPIDLDETGA